MKFFNLSIVLWGLLPGLSLNASLPFGQGTSASSLEGEAQLNQPPQAGGQLAASSLTNSVPSETPGSLALQCGCHGSQKPEDASENEEEDGDPFFDPCDEDHCQDCDVLDPLLHPACWDDYARFLGRIDHRARALRNAVKRLDVKIRALEKEFRQSLVSEEELTSLSNRMNDVSTRLITAENSLRKRHTEYCSEFAKLEEKFDSNNNAIRIKLDGLQDKIKAMVRASLAESAAKQEQANKETLGTMTDNMTAIKRILGLPINNETIDLVDNNISILIKGLDVERKRIDELKAQLGPVRDLGTHQLFAELNPSMPTAPLTVTQMLTEVADALIEGRKTLQGNVNSAVEAGLEDVCVRLDQHDQRLDTDDGRIEALEALMEGTSKEDLAKLKTLEAITESEVTKQLQDKSLIDKISLSYNVYVAQEIAKISQRYQADLEALKAEIPGLKATDTSLDERVAACAEALEQLRSYVGNGSGGGNTGIGGDHEGGNSQPSDGSLLAQLAALREEVKALTEQILGNQGGTGSEIPGGETSGGSDPSFDALSLRAQINQLRIELTQSQANAAQDRADLANRVQALEEADFATQIRGAEQRVSDRLTPLEAANLDARVTALENQNPTQIDVAALEQTLATLSSNMNLLTTLVMNDHQTTLKNHNESINALTERLNQQEATIASLASDNQSLKVLTNQIVSLLVNSGLLSGTGSGDFSSTSTRK